METNGIYLEDYLDCLGEYYCLEHSIFEQYDIVPEDMKAMFQDEESEPQKV